MVELGKSPVYEPQLALSGESSVAFNRCITHLAAFTIKHDVAWFYISVHDTTSMREVQCLDDSISSKTANTDRYIP